MSTVDTFREIRTLQATQVEDPNFIRRSQMLGSAGLHAVMDPARENFSAMRSALAEDSAKATRLEKAALLGTAACSAIDLPFHESIYGDTTSHVFANAKAAGASNLHCILSTGLTAGALTMGIEGTIAVGMAISLNAFPKTAEHIAKTLLGKDRDGDKTQSAINTTPQKAKFLWLYGSGPFQVKHHSLIEASDRGTTKEIRVGLKAAAYLMSANTAFFSGIAGLVLGGEVAPWHWVERTATDSVQLAKNPLTYFALITAVLSKNKIQGALKNRKLRQAKLAEASQKTEAISFSRIPKTNLLPIEASSRLKPSEEAI